MRESPYLVARLRLTGFRNFSSLDLELHPGFNVAMGQNAQGKTNLLESLHLVSTTRVLRGVRDAEAVQWDGDHAEVEVELKDSGTKLGVELRPGQRKRATLNGVSLPKASDLLGRLPSVCISALDLELVRGEPSDRRLFLDLELSSLHASYLRDLALYRRALDQRNALLKAAQESHVADVAFEPWEETLATAGASLRAAREEWVAEIEPLGAAIHAEIAAGEMLSLVQVQKDSASDAESLLQLMTSERGREIARGSTLFGPHRDDLEISVSGSEAKLYGSQGQQRTAVISLKLACFEHSARVLGAKPLLLMDDMLSDLDSRRRQFLAEWVLANADQAILTCTEAAAAGPGILSRSRVFEVRAGTIVG